MISDTVLGVLMLFGILLSFAFYTLGILNNVFDNNKYVPLHVDISLLIMFAIAIIGTVKLL